MDKSTRMDWDNLHSRDGETRYRAFMRLLDLKPGFCIVAGEIFASVLTQAERWASPLLVIQSVPPRPCALERVAIACVGQFGKLSHDPTITGQSRWFIRTCNRNTL